MIFVLLIIFQLKHFLADYPLQTSYMLGKFKDKGWVLPLTAHCGVHFLFTFTISYIFLYFDQIDEPYHRNLGIFFLIIVGFISFLLGLLDFSIHFVMDRIKASPKLLGRYEALSKNEFKNILSYSETLGIKHFKPQIKSNTLFWWSLGLDQMVHHLTDILIIYILLGNS